MVDEGASELDAGVQVCGCASPIERASEIGAKKEEENRRAGASVN